MWNSNKTDSEWYLEQELERERQYRREEQERYQRERERRMSEYRQQAEEYYHTADNWREALQKQIYLASKETWDEGLAWVNYPDLAHDTYFTEMEAACKRALQIWKSEETKVADEIAELEKRITELKDSIRFNVGKRLEQEKYYRSSGWRGVADQLQEKDADPSSWLDW